MKVKGKKGTRLGEKKKILNKEQQADVETHVKANDEMMKSNDDVCISSQLKRPMLHSSGEPLVDIPESIKSSAELYRGKLRNFKATQESKGCSSKQGKEQSSTSKLAKNQKTMMTTIDTAERSILKHDQRKQQSLTAGSSIQVARSAQIQRKKQDDRTVVRSLIDGLSNSFSAQFQKDHVDHVSSKKQKTTSKCPSMSLDDYFRRNMQQLDVEDSINYENDGGEKTNDNCMQEMKSKGDVYINSQFKRPMLPSNREPLEDIPESIKWMFFKELFSKQGMEQSSTLMQAKNQKKKMSTVDTAERSILNHDQRKQRSGSTLKQAKNHKTTMSTINPAGRSIFKHDQTKQRSTLNQAKSQKTMMSAIDTAVRSILNHDQRKQQSMTAGSSIQVAGSAKMQHKKQDHMTAVRSLPGGLSNSSQFQNDSVCHVPSMKQKTLPMCPAMSLDDYFQMYKQQLDVEGDINYENDDEFEGDINYENHDGEKTNDNPMEGGVSRKRTRGSTRCLKIHYRSPGERQEITLNEEGEPIGPTQKIVSEFSNFLGSVARMSDLCPLIYTNWKAIPNKKENIWAYVNERYIVPEKGEKAVYAIINDAWRRYKCSVKKNHFTKYENMRERLKNRPDSIPEEHFRKLMNYWSFNIVQEISQTNAKNTAKQKCRHRAGPISFAIIRERLRATKDDREPPTRAEVFIETRQSKRGNQPDEVTNNVITNLQDLIINSGQSSDEAFQTIFGKEKPGRLRCHGRLTTPSSLKRIKAMAEIENKHAAVVKNLTDKVQEMEEKHEKMEAKHSKEMAAMEGKLQMLLRVMLNQSNSSRDMGNLVALLSTPDGDNNNFNALHSSSSAHAPNNHEVNHGTMDEEQFPNDLEEDDEEQLSDDLEEDNEEQLSDDSEEEDPEYSD